MYFSTLAPSTKTTAWDAFPLQKSRPPGAGEHWGSSLSSSLSELIRTEGQTEKQHSPSTMWPTVSLTCRGRVGFTKDARVAALSPCDDLDRTLKAEDVECP